MFQLAWGESSVLVSALSIAIAEYERRLTNPWLGEEARVQLRIAQDMLDRLINPPARTSREDNVRALSEYLGKGILDL